MATITVILTAYRRDHFREQIPAIQAQRGVDISTIHLWQNEAHVDLSYVREMGVKLIRSDHNFSYWGRFAIAYAADTDYVAIFDDDLIPGPDWLANAIRCCRLHNCIAGGNGRVLKGEIQSIKEKVENEEIDDAGVWHMVGDNGRAIRDTPVDFVGHCWVFNIEHLGALFRERPVDFATGEDIHFGMAARLHLGVPSYVARQRNPEESAHMRNYWNDAASSCARPGVLKARLAILEEWRRRGIPAVSRPWLHEAFEEGMNRLRNWKRRLTKR